MRVFASNPDTAGVSLVNVSSQYFKSFLARYDRFHKCVGVILLFYLVLFILPLSSKLFAQSSLSFIWNVNNLFLISSKNLQCNIKLLFIFYGQRYKNKGFKMKNFIDCKEKVIMISFGKLSFSVSRLPELAIIKLTEII